MEEESKNTEDLEHIESLAEKVETERASASEEETTISAVTLNSQQKIELIQSLLYAASEPLKLAKIKEITSLEEEEILTILESISKLEPFPFEIKKISGGYQLRTKIEFAPFISKLKEEKPKRLSAPALETLAIIAYRQPIVKSDIEKIRGVDCTPTIKTLLERDLVRMLGHQATVGQPALYGTSENFLKIFGLNSIADLPTLRELNMFDSDPGEQDEGDEEREGVELQENVQEER